MKVEQCLVGFLGPRGTFSEEAARRFAASLSTVSCRFIDYADIPELLRAADRGQVDYAVVPIENSLAGSVPVTVDMLVHEITCPIRGEVIIPVRHNLLAAQPMPLEEVETVLSHPQALAQCQLWLQRFLPHARQVATRSTAEAAQMAARGGRTAAIGTATAAAIYRLHFLARDIQDSPGNLTRFVVVGREAPPASQGDEGERHYVTSLAFSFPVDRPGNLYRALGEFATRGINLTKLESRPTRTALGSYLFWVDLEGHVEDPAVAASLEALRPRCALFKLLGSYARAPMPHHDEPPVVAGPARG